MIIGKNVSADSSVFAPMPIKFGRKVIKDVMNPQPDEIDTDAIGERLDQIRRFSGDPNALTVWEHICFVYELAQHAGENARVCCWALIHDHHEAITSDIPAPIKAAIRAHSNVLDVIEWRLDAAICTAINVLIPPDETRERVAIYDRAAAAIEWQIVLGNPPADWNAPFGVSEDVAHKLLAKAGWFGS